MLLNRIIPAMTTIPSLHSWLTTGAGCLLLALLIVPIGFAIGFLKWDVIRSPPIIGSVVAIALVAPGITEELLFRVVLLPHPSESVSPFGFGLWISISLGLFILYHPLNALTFYPAGNPTFMRPGFLFLALLLGMDCTLAYLQTGSLWLPVLIHWLAVVIWLLLLGGYHQLHNCCTR